MGCIRPAIISTRNHYWSAVAREKKTTCVEQHSSRAAHVFGGKLTSAVLAALVFANLLNFELVGLLAELFQADLGCRARLPAPLPHGHCTAARCGSTSGPSTAFGGNLLLKLAVYSPRTSAQHSKKRGQRAQPCNRLPSSKNFHAQANMLQALHIPGPIGVSTARPGTAVSTCSKAASRPHGLVC